MARSRKKKASRVRKHKGAAGREVARDRRQPDDRLDDLLNAVATNPDDVQARLALGKHYFRQNLESEIVDVVESLEAKYPFGSKHDCDLYDRLLAFGYTSVNRLLDAEKICRRGLAATSAGLDYHFVCSYIHLSLREYDKAVASANEYLAQFDELRAASATPDEFTFSDAHRSQVFNYLGSCLQERGELDNARVQFDLALQADPGNHLPYLNLVNIARRQNDVKTAKAIVARGLDECRQIQELRLLSESFKRAVTISACMIVKDEEELLPGCLDSIRDWVDEIVIVDTGSTDHTIEIAESYGARVYHQPWEGDFSKHRNYSIELATCDWVFIIDADERFNKKDVPLLLNSVNREEHKVISVNVFNLYGSIDHKLTSVNSIRFFRRELNIRYRGIVHNSPCIPKGITISRAPIAMEHLGYDLSPEKMKAKFDRSKALLEKQIEENPDFAFAWFNLAQLYRGVLCESLEEYGPMVLQAAERTVELTDYDDVQGDRQIHLMALDQLGWTHFYLKDYDRAEHFTRRALAIKPNYLDPLMLLGNIYADTKQYDKAMEAYQKYLDVQAEYDEHIEIDSLILFHPESRAMALYGMGAIAELTDDPAKAKEYYRKALAETSGYVDASLNLGRIHMNEGNFTEAERLFLNQMETKQPSVLAALGLGYIYLQQKQHKKAEQYYEKALEIEPSHLIALVKAGEFFRETGRIDKARELYQQAYDLGSAEPEVLQPLAAIYFADGRYQQAAELYQRIIEQQPDQAEILNDLGNCYFRLQDHDRAEDCYRQALDTCVAPGVTYRNRGLNLVRLGKLNEAIIAFEKYMAIEPGQPEILRILGDLYRQAGDYGSAVSYYEQVLISIGDDTPALFNLSECYLLMGHRDSAIVGYRRILASAPDFAPARDRLSELAPVTGPA